MADVLTIDQKKEIALGRDRNKALSVLMPCIFATAELGVLARHGKRHTMLVSKSGTFETNFMIDDVLPPDGEPVFYFRVIWNQRYVMTGNLLTSKMPPLGHHPRPLGGYLRLFDWRRSYDVRRWQAELFDTFPLAPGWDQPRSEASLFLDKVLGPYPQAAHGV